jgi:hypothetical protein
VISGYDACFLKAPSIRETPRAYKFKMMKGLFNG